MSPAALPATLALALGLAKICGYLFDRLRLPPALGQILAGLLLAGMPGPVPGVLRGESFGALGELGLLLLLLVTGTESRVSDMRRAGRAALLVALGGVAAPLAAGYAAARYLGLDHGQSVVVGALLTPTSIGVTAVTLLEAGRLRTSVGATLVGAAIVDDLLALGLLAVVLGAGGLLALTLKGAGFLAGAVFAGWFLLPRLYRRARQVHLPEAGLSIVLTATFALAALAEGAGVAAITGAFVAGLAVRERLNEERLMEGLHAVANGLFVPLFFVRLGATMDFTGFGTLGRFAPLLLLASFGGKFLGSAAGALAARAGAARAVQVGVGMLPRMEVSLVVAALAVGRGLFPGELGDAIVGFTLLNIAASLLATPLLLAAAFRLEPTIETVHTPAGGAGGGG